MVMEMMEQKIASLLVLLWLCFLFSYQNSTSFSNQEASLRQDHGKTSVSSRIIKAQRKCPQMMKLSPCQHWHTVTNETWRWHNKPCHDDHRSGKVIAVSRENPERRSIKDIVTNKNDQTSIVFYGSSHVRELYLSLIRLERGLPFDELLEDTVTRVASADPSNQAACDPYKEGWGNLEGVDMNVCGEPTKRLVPELADRVAIGFHTFLHTPDADQLFLDWLEAASLRQPDVLVVDVGIWGPRGSRVGGSATTVWTIQEELDYYLSWIQSSFPTTVLVFVMDQSTSGGLFYSQLEFQIQSVVASNGRAVMLRKDLVMKALPETMPCGHGCNGPVLVVLANLFMDWLEQARAHKGLFSSSS